MIMRGLALNIKDTWEKKELSPKLENIIRDHGLYFAGQITPGAHAIKV